MLQKVLITRDLLDGGGCGRGGGGEGRGGEGRGREVMCIFFLFVTLQF